MRCRDSCWIIAACNTQSINTLLLKVVARAGTSVHLHMQSRPVSAVAQAESHKFRENNNMGINLGDVVPDFKAETSQGDIQWHGYIDGTWAILFSHPGDFTPVCTTELGA